MRETGTMTRLKVEEPMSTLTEPSMSAIGKKTASMDMASKPGPITLAMKATTSLARSTALELSSGPMDHLILESFITTTSMARECTPGRTIESMRVSGAQIRCMERAPLLGLTAESTSENMPRTRRRGTVSSSGQMADATEANGSTASNTEKDPLSPVQVRRNTANGRMVKESDG